MQQREYLIYLFISSFLKCLLTTYYVLDAVSTGNTKVTTPHRHETLPAGLKSHRHETLTLQEISELMTLNNHILST